MTEARRLSVERLKKEGHYKRAGAIGGRKTKRNMLKKDPNYYSSIGSLGGQAMLDRYGKDFYSRIGSIQSSGRKEGNEQK